MSEFKTREFFLIRIELRGRHWILFTVYWQIEIAVECMIFAVFF